MKNSYLKKLCRRLAKSQTGQSATEYMLILAIVVLGCVVAASHFLPAFQEGVDAMSARVKTHLSTDHTMEGSQ